MFELGTLGLGCGEGALEVRAVRPTSVELVGQFGIGHIESCCLIAEGVVGLLELSTSGLSRSQSILKIGTFGLAGVELSCQIRDHGVEVVNLLLKLTVALGELGNLSLEVGNRG